MRNLAWEWAVFLGQLLPLCLPLLAMANNRPLPRPVRRQRRAAHDKGLPDDDELRSLARVFLTKSRATWPELVVAGVFPERTDEVVTTYVENFKRRHRGGPVGQIDLRPFTTRDLLLAANYPRFSDSKSQAKSITDQVSLAIDFGKSRNCVVHWELLFADYACSASSGRRQGFESLLKMIASKPPQMDFVLIDDFARGSRNEYESWKLAGLCKTSDIRLMGVSDGFHLDDPDWDLKVRLFNLFHEMEAKYRRQRVLRGQLSTANSKAAIGRLPLGYTRKHQVNAHGNVIYKPNGVARTERWIDPEASVWVKEIFELFIVKKLSTYKIAKEFSRRGVDGCDYWSDVMIDKLLINPAYIGLFIWNRKSEVYDWTLGKKVWKKNPWQKWKQYYDPDLALVPKAWHVEARKRLEKPRNAPGKTKRRQPQRLASTLFSGTLFCGSCGTELTLHRSTPKYKHLGCKHGLFERKGCKLTCSKSARAIESALLGVIAKDVLTEERIADLVVRANQHLAELRAKPRQDLRPMQRSCAKLRQKIDTLLGRLAGTLSEALVTEYEAAIEKLQQEFKLAAEALHLAQRANEPPPAELDLERVKGYLSDLRALLNQEIPAAAVAIRALTGPISITQKPYAHRLRRSGRVRGSPLHSVVWKPALCCVAAGPAAGS